MKKFVLMTFMLSLSLLTVCSCTPTIGNEPTAAPPQPIPFDSLGDAMAFLKKGDLSEYDRYPENYRIAYREMIELFMNDGFILNAEVNSEDFAVVALYLMPEQRYEDAGIIWNVTFENQGYQIAVYHVKTECQEEGDDLNQYRARRFDGTAFESVKNGDVVIYYQSPSDGGSGRIMQYIDETHYYVIRSKASIEDKIALLNAIHFEKVAIE